MALCHFFRLSTGAGGWSSGDGPSAAGHGEHPHETASAASTGDERRNRSERGGNPTRPGLLRWRARTHGIRLPVSLAQLPRGEGHLPPDQRSHDGQMHHKLQILMQLQKKRCDGELESLIESLETNDTWNGYQGPPKPPPKMDACCVTDTVDVIVVEKVDSAMVTDTVPTIQKITMDMGIVTDQELKAHAIEAKVGPDEPQVTTDTGTDAITDVKEMHSIEVGTDDMPTAEPPAAKVAKIGKPLPKKVPQALNEMSAIVDPNKLVDWTRIVVPMDMRDDVLGNLAKELHIRTRIPEIDLIRQKAIDKFRDSSVIQNAAKDHQLTMEEAHVLLACPNHLCPNDIVHSNALSRHVALVLLSLPHASWLL